MVTNEIDYGPIVDILEDIFGEYKFHNDYSGQISFDCPVCSYDLKGLDHGDGKGNLEINYMLSVYKCWSCSESHGTYGHIKWLIKKYGSPKQIKHFDLMYPDENGEIGKKEYKPVVLPKEFILLSNVSDGFKLTHHYKRARNYLKVRNITDDMIKKHNIGFCYEGEYSDRIIIPSFDSNRRVNYFIGRSYLTKPLMKYKNPEAEKEIIIWNEQLINWDLPVFLVEGVFDSIFLPNSIPMLGKKISDLLYMLLYKKECNIVIVLDGDAWSDAEKLYHKLNCGKLFGKVKIIKLPLDKDIADLEGKLDDYKQIELN